MQSSRINVWKQQSSNSDSFGAIFSNIMQNLTHSMESLLYTTKMCDKPGSCLISHVLTPDSLNLMCGINNQIIQNLMHHIFNHNVKNLPDQFNENPASNKTTGSYRKHLSTEKAQPLFWDKLKSIECNNHIPI